MSRYSFSTPVAHFFRRLVAAMVLVFGFVTVVNNGAVLFLVTPEGRAELGAIPYPLFWFDFLMGLAYLADGVGIGWRKPWAHPLAWSLAVLHSLSATALWLWYLSGHAVDGRMLAVVLFREGFWVCIGLYLWRAQPLRRRSTAAPPPPPAGT